MRHACRAPSRLFASRGCSINSSDGEIPMARITVDDCIKFLPNRFELTLAATNRARQIALGATPQAEPNKDKPTVSALREIASGKVGKELLNPPTPTPPVL